MNEQFNEKDSLQKDIESQTTSEGVKSFIDDTEAWGGHEDIVAFAKDKLEKILAEAGKAEQTSESQTAQISEMGGNTETVAEKTKDIDKQIEEVQANAAASIAMVENQTFSQVSNEGKNETNKEAIEKQLSEFEKGKVFKGSPEGRGYIITKSPVDQGAFYLAEAIAVVGEDEDPSFHHTINIVLNKSKDGLIENIMVKTNPKVEANKPTEEVVENNINTTVAEPEKATEVKNETSVESTTVAEPETAAEVKSETAVESTTATETQVESSITPKTETGPEKVVSKGEERYNKISNTITTQKNKFTGWISRGTEGLGKLIKKGLIGAFNAPEDISHGVKVVGEKIGEEYGYAKESVKEGFNFVGEKIDEGVKSIGDDYNKFDKATDEKASKMGEWIGFSAAMAYESSSNWVKDKKIKTENIVGGVSLATETVLSLAKDKSIEKLDSAKESIKKSFKEIKKYGEGALDTAKLWAWYKKDDYNKKKNAIKESYLKKKTEIEYNKIQKILAKSAQLNQIGKKGEKLEYKIAA